MQTIKFRGKRVDNGEWIYGDLFISHKDHHSPSVSISTDEFHPVGYGSKTWYEVRPKTVGQFTGLHDKNGKEIYSGDKIMHNGGVIKEVFYNAKQAAFYAQFSTGGGFVDPVSYFLERDCEVVGTIHDEGTP